MKILILISLCTLLVIGVFGQDDDISRHPTSPKTGFAIDPETNQKIKELYFVLQADNTKRHGKYNAFNFSNVLIVEGHYNKGMKHGLWKTYYMEAPNNLKSEGRYNNDKKSGKWTYYYNKAGKLKKEEVEFANNGNTKIVVLYNENGTKQGEGSYQKQNGKYYETGIWVYYHPNGKKESEGEFVYSAGAGKSVKKGEWRYWFPGGGIKLIKNYNVAGQLDGKITYYNSRGEIEKYEYYANGALKRTENRFSFQKEKLQELLKEAEKFKTDFPEIFSGEIADYKKQYSAFINAPKKDEANFKKGNKLLENVKIANAAFEDLKKQKASIDKLTKAVIDNYKKDFPKIAKAQIEPFQNQIASYAKMGQISQKLEAGKGIVEKLNFFDEKRKALIDNDKKIKAEAPKMKETYQKTFPNIYKGEIKVFENQITAYYDITNLDERIKKSGEILSRITDYNKKFERLRIINTELINKSSIMIGYGDKYPSIQKNLSPLIDKAIEEYHALTEIDKKVEKGESIAKFLTRLEGDYTKIQKQTDKIEAKWQEFSMKFEDDKNNKFIYKRAKVLYNLYIDALDKQAASNSRLSYGEYTLRLLNHFLGYFGKDNSELNEKLKTALNPKEIKEAFGITE